MAKYLIKDPAKVIGKKSNKPLDMSEKEVKERCKCLEKYLLDGSTSNTQDRVLKIIKGQEGKK